MIILFTVMLGVVFTFVRWKSISWLDRPWFISDAEQTIDVTYISWMCNCANFIEVKNKDASLSAETIFIEPSNNAIDILKDPAFQENRYRTVRLTGRFYHDKGISTEYKTGFLEDKPEHACVFLYDAKEYIAEPAKISY